MTGRGKGWEERFGSRWHMAVQQDFPLLAHDADVHGAGMPINAAVTWVRVGGESHEVSSFFCNHLFIPTASIPLRYAEGGGLIHYQPTGADGPPRTRFLPFSSVSRCGPPFTASVAMTSDVKGCQPIFL